MRKFYLENSIGERKDLQTKQEIHLRDPAGLGWADNNVYADARGFFPRTDSRPVQPAVTGDFVIKGYDTYKELVDWIHKGYDLTLVYNPDGTEYRIDVDIQSLHKGEINSWGRLECPFVMMAKTPWYRPSTRELSIAPPSSEVGYKRYNYAYPYQYSAASLLNSVEMTASGHMQAAIYLTCPGPLTNPSVTLTLGNVVIGKMDLAGVSILSGETLIFSTRFGSIGVWKDSTDLLSYLDLNNNNFFQIPVNETVTLTIESDSDIATIATIKLYEYFRGV
jgi:hypothetical protein